MDDLISKKDLLQTCGISYGQLYRWKRKGLIPEDWFVRKPTFTGTETFFPRDRVLARIAKIQAMKSDDLSLEEIGDVFTPDLAEISLTSDEIVSRRLSSKGALDLYASDRRNTGAFVLGEVLTLRIIDDLLEEGTITADEVRGLSEVMQAHFAACGGKDCELVLLRKVGLSLWLLAPRGCEVHFEDAARVVARVDLTRRLEALRTDIGEG